MNKKRWLHIILFCIGVSFSSQAKGYSTSKKVVLQTKQDTLIVDSSTISPRYFDDIKNKYNDDDFIYERNIENSGWWTRFKQWLSDFFRDLFNLKNQGQASKVTNLAIKIGGVILFLLVVYFIFKAIVNKEGTWVFGKSSDKNIIPVTDIENNIHVVDFKTLIKNAESNNNYRLAVRYYYLWLLKSMTSAEIIEYDVEKTNSDYQNEIIIKTIKQEFSYTSYLYNYIWYGEFDVNQEQFSKAKHAFVNLLNSIEV